MVKPQIGPLKAIQERKLRTNRKVRESKRRMKEKMALKTLKTKP